MILSAKAHNAVFRVLHGEWQPPAKVQRLTYDVPRLAALTGLPLEEAYILGAALHARQGILALRSEELQSKALNRVPNQRLIDDVTSRLEAVGRAIKEYEERVEPEPLPT